MLNWLKRLLGCERRARSNQLHVFAWRVRHATTAEECFDIALDAITAGCIAEVGEMLDAKRLPPDEAIALRLYRGYFFEEANA